MSRPSRFTNPGANTLFRVGGYADQPPGNDPPTGWPGTPTEPDDFPDRALEQPAQVPVALGTPALAQPIQSTRVLIVDGQTGTITFDDPLTPGNVMVAGIGFRENIGATADLEGDGWNLIEDAFTGAEAGNWPGFMYWRTVQPGDGQSWDCTRSAGSGGFGFWMMELEGVATLDGTPLSSSNVTTEPTGSLTPGTGAPVMLVSFASVRNDTDQAFTPAGSMSEQLDTFYGPGDDGPQVAVNTQSITTPSGSYTVGSTYGGGSQRFLIAASFAGGTGFADGLNSVDGDDATYDETSTAEVLRVDLGDEYAIGRVRWLVGSDTSGAKAYDLFGANEPDFSDEVLATDLDHTATGSYTADEVTETWTPAGSYRFWRVVGPAESRRTFSFELYEVPSTSGGGVTDHPSLTDRDAADQHPADSVSLDPSGMSIVTATDVQAGIAELDAAVANPDDPRRAADLETHHRFIVTAHLGDVNDTDGYPEGSLEAYRQAVKKGAHRVDIDCRQSSNGTWWSMHDATLNRTTNLSGDISAASDATLNGGHIDGGIGYDAGRHGSTILIPTVEEILTALAAMDCTFQLDNKLGTAASAESLAALAQSLGVSHRCIFNVYGGATEQNALTAAAPEIGQISDRETSNDWTTPAWDSLTDEDDVFAVAPRKVTGVVDRDDYGTADEDAIVQFLWGIGARGITCNDVEVSVAAWQALEYGASSPSGGGTSGHLLIASVHSTPLVFDDILQNSEGTDFLYASE